MLSNFQDNLRAHCQILKSTRDFAANAEMHFLAYLIEMCILEIQNQLPDQVVHHCREEVKAHVLEK